MRSIDWGNKETNRTPRFQLITNNKLQEIKPPAMGNQQLIEIGDGTCNYINRTLRLPAATYIILYICRWDELCTCRRAKLYYLVINWRPRYDWIRKRYRTQITTTYVSENIIAGHSAICAGWDISISVLFPSRPCVVAIHAVMQMCENFYTTMCFIFLCPKCSVTCGTQLTVTA